MVRKSGYRFSRRIMPNEKWEHDPESWMPVFRIMLKQGQEG
jgi:hypothetical protein